ncbi:DUF4055 domain-containing protein [Variovorax sp. J22R193]|uniref:DUF4055 domain-containing protein n=1 Tax=Variovorax fucosicus TaxID=3053517 RepID=UPI0025781631|nr:DUF4055 domain-containing protein [Variovorax sp. J22R193]MDM0041869.1 DUF4055 domain-containing protein [Variovorax sp. J22R193]
MPADTQSKQYKERLPQWERCRAAIAGQDSVHAGGAKYLPALGEQTPAEYDAYRLRAPWYGATGRTLEGMVGMVFRSDPQLVAPDALKQYAVDITLSGVTLDGVAREALSEVIGLGRYGLLVEYPQVIQQPASLADASAQNLRPYVTAYKTEHIINWKLQRVNNAMQPTMVVLQESYEEAIDEFESEGKTQYRALLLEDGRYVQRLYRTGDKGAVVQYGADIVPTKNGKPLTAIPFFPFGPEALSIEVQQAPILDLVDLNLSHYRTGADLEHGAHFTGLPTPFIAGVQLESGEKVKIGSSQAIVSPDPSATASYLEFTGQGLGSLERLMDRKEGQMAALGARMLAPEKAGVEAANTLSMRHNGEDSVLAGIAKLVGYGIQEMMIFVADWAGIPGEVTYKLNTDYLPAGMSAQDLTALMSAWQQGGISRQTLFENLQRSEIVAADVTLEQEQARIDSEGPTLAMQSAMKPEPEDNAPPEDK